MFTGCFHIGTPRGVGEWPLAACLGWVAGRPCRTAACCLVALPPLPPPAALPRPPALQASEDVVRKGAQLYGDTCSRCHGDGAVGGVKDLRWMTPERHAAFDDIVLKGIRADRGMASFGDLLTREQADAIHAYLIARGNEDWADAAAEQHK